MLVFNIYILQCCQKVARNYPMCSVSKRYTARNCKPTVFIKSGDGRKLVFSGRYNMPTLRKWLKYAKVGV